MTLVWRPGFQFDADASTYIEAVEAADTQALETGVRYAINDFVIGCKNDGIWSAIKASCILAGARTLDGALVPLAGTAPTNNNFVFGDYNRKTGLLGNGSTKYLNTNRLCSAEIASNTHFSFYVSEDTSNYNVYGGAYVSSPGFFRYIIRNLDSNYRFSCNTTNQTASSGFTLAPSNTPRFLGVTSSQPGTVNARLAGQSYSTLLTHTNVPALNHFVFSRNNDGTPDSYASSRVAFYSVGESLDLALLDARVTDLMTAIGTAIP